MRPVDRAAPEFTVRAVRCSHAAGADEIFARLRAATSPLERSWRKISNARSVGIKVNMQMRADAIRRHRGRRQELVDDDVLRATLRLLRERTRARLFCLDSSFAPPGRRPGPDFNTGAILAEFDVPYVEAGDPPLARYAVPGGGIMFREYLLPASIREADAFVSLAKMKSHGFMGVTLSLKNLFGLPPIPPHGRVRSYFHHPVRLPYVLCDLGLVVAPCLNVVDGLVGQSAREWDGEGRVADTLVAGDHPIATDACAARLMGHDPALDFPAPPYRRERSALSVAAEHGFGTTDLREIDFASEVEGPVAAFDSVAQESPARAAALRRSAAEQALHYRDRRAWFVARYAGEFVYLREGEVVWHGADPTEIDVARLAGGGTRARAAWLKLVDPDEREGERFERYEEVLAATAATRTTSRVRRFFVRFARWGVAR